MMTNDLPQSGSLIPVSGPAAGGGGPHPDRREAAAKPVVVPPLTLWNLLKALRRHWLPATTLGVLLGAAVAAALWFCLPWPKQTARVLLRVLPFEPYFLKPQPTDGYNFDMFKQSQGALVKSRFVLNEALKQPGVSKLSIIQEQPDPLVWLEKEIRVDFSVSPEIMRISLNGDRGPELAVIVNAVTTAYMAEAVDKEKNKRRDKLDDLRKTLNQFDGKLTKKRGSLEDVIKAAGTGNAQLLLLKQQLAIQQVGALKSELIAVQGEIRKLKVKAQMELELQKGPEELMALLGSFLPPHSGIPLATAGLVKRQGPTDEALSAALSGQIEESIQADPDFHKYLKQQDELVGLIAALKRINAPDAPRGPLEANEADLVSIRAKMDAKRKELRPKILEKLRVGTRGTPVSAMAKLRAELNEFALLEKVVQKEIDQLTRENNSLSQYNFDLETIKDELARTEVWFKMTATQIDNLEVEERAPARITRQELEAVVYNGERSTTRLATVGLGGFGSFALVLLAFGWFEFRIHRVSGPDQVSYQLGINVVGTLPDYTRTAARENSAGRYESILSDSVDAVRTVLLFMSKMEGIRTVLVTSAGPGEGKTTSACHLAASLARAGRKTLLVDCDLRNPMVHNVFKIPQEPGLSEVLRGEADVQAAIQPTPLEGLFILPAGQGDALAVRALAMDHTPQTFKRLREDFDFMVVDSSPILPVPDSLLVAQHTDAVVFSVLRNVSRLTKVQAAFQRLATLRVRILGAIFNGSKAEAYSGYAGNAPK